MFKIWLKRLFLLAAGLAIGSTAQADAVPFADTQDGFTYAFLEDLTYPTLESFGFPGILAVANDSGGGQNHIVDSFVEFGGLNSSGLTPAQVSSATLTLTVDTAGAGFGPTPTPSAPVTVDLYAAGAAWNSTTIDWANQPGAATPPGLLGQVTDTGSLSTVTFDVTSLVKSWLGGSLTNNGFILSQDNAGTQSDTFYSMGASSGQPTLAVNTFPTPEPGSLSLAAVAVGAAGLWQFLRRRQGVQGK